MSEEIPSAESTPSSRVKTLIMDYGAAFLLGWILGGGMGQQLWDSITGVL